MGRLVSRALQDVGVDLYREESLTGFEVHNGRVKAVVTDQRVLEADIVILGMGVHAGFTVSQMVYMDLSYAPPYSPVWDPILIAARRAAAEL
jgi:flavin-dependent dehydrogenase